MSKFSIIPKGGGTARYSGCPTFTGTYMKPGMLEFREVASPTPVGWMVGDYVAYSRTGLTYRLYGIPQVKKQARSTKYGGAFIYQSVQLFDDSKQLEICPFRDLVPDDNRIHFSTQPSISTFEAVDGIARRIQACLDDMYPDSWVVRLATTEMGASQDLVDLMAEAREFTVSGVSLLGALDKVYEVWPEVGWVFSHDSTTGKNVLTIGGAGLTSTASYQYSKGNGLNSITRTAANADEIANRIFAYGSSRNMLPGWYNSQNIKDAESVDIQNLMIPVSEWGLTDGERDAAKAYVEDDDSIAKNGLRPVTVYFDGSGEYSEIYPTLRETTIGMVRTAIGDSTAKYYPSTAIYADPGARIDKLLSAQANFDSGLAGDVGKSAAMSESEVLGNLSGSGSVAGGLNTSIILATRTYTMSKTNPTDLYVSITGDGTITTSGGNGVVSLAISIQKGDGTDFSEVKRQLFELEKDENDVFHSRTVSTKASEVSIVAGDVIRVYLSVFIMNTGSTALSYLYSLSPGFNFSAEFNRKKTFNISVRQLGFDIEAQANLGDGKTIAMRSGKCAGRSFSIKSVQYESATDSWALECWRSEDESLSQWFPNTDYPVRGVESSYDGDEFVLLDIAMPDIYVQMAEQRLLTAAQELLSDVSVERWQYIPEIDAKFMVEFGRSILPAQNMVLTDVDIVGASPESILIDTVTISEGEAAIPTYKVTLRDRKRKTFTEATGADGISSKSVGNATQDIESLLASQSVGESYFTLDANGNVTLKEQYKNLWVPGWLAAGGIGSGGSGGGGGLITSVKGVADLGTSIPTESLTETFSAKAIETIWEAVLDLQQGSNVSLVNGASYSTLTVNGTSAQLYTKAQVDGLIGSIEQFHYEIYASTSAVTNPQGNILYLIGPTGSGSDKYEEYVYANNSWTKIGDTTIDLSGYVQKVSGGTSGNFASLNSSGGIVDSGHKHGDYVTALGTSGNNLTWTKNGVTNNIAFPTLSKGTTSGSGNAVTDITVSGHTISLSKGTTFITNGDVLQTTNPFKPGHNLYISKIENALYAANKRFTVTGELIDGTTTTSVTSDQLAALFNGNYDNGYTLRDGKTLKIHITFDGWPNSYFPGYPYGYFFLSFYYVCKPQSVSARCYCNYEAHGIGWHDLTVSDLSSGSSAYLYRLYNGYYNISEFEFTIVGDTTNSYGYTYITQLELQLTRPDPSRNPFISKYVAEELYYPLTIDAGLTVTGNTSIGGTLGVTGATTLSNTLSVANAITLSGNTSAKRRIYFGDTSHYLELDQYGFHFSHGVYSDGFVAAGGIGNGSGGGSATELGNLVDVSLSSTSNGDLLVYNSTTNHWENKPQSSIIPSVSISFNDLTSHPTTISGYGITDAKIENGVITLGGNTITPLTSSDLSNYALKTGAWNYNFQVNSLVLAGGTLTGPLSVIGANRLIYSYTIGGASVDDPVQTVQKTVAYLDDIPAHQTVTLTGGTNNGTLKLTTAAGTVDNIAVTGLQALAYKSSLAASDIPDISGAYVTISGTQTITGSKTFSTDIITGSDIVPSADLGSSLGYSNRRFSNGNIQTIGTSTLNLKNSSSGNSGMLSANGGYLVIRAGSDVTTTGSFKQLVLHETYGFYPDTAGVNLGYTGSNNRWANIYGINGNLTGDLTLASTSHIDLGPVRLEFANGALHVTTNDSTNYPTIGFYADGFVAAGGIGSGSGGGGGYGVEDITTNQDGTIEFHFTGGDVTTVDLNHEHPQYPRYVHLSSESEMPSNPDPDTMYIIDGEGGGGGSSYTLPIASASTLGGVKVGGTLSINGTTGEMNVGSSFPKYVLLADEAAYTALATKDSGTLYLIPKTS